MIDSHCHLNHPRFAGDLEAVRHRAAAAGVTRILVPGYDLASSRAAVALAERYPEIVAAVGVHPHDAATLDTAALEELRRLAAGPRVVAIGEIGVDFYRDLSPRETQVAAFRAQLQLARSLGLPVIIHQREAGDACRQVCREEGAGEAGGVWHCFSGDQGLAQFAVAQGFALGFTGNVTYPRAEDIVRAARAVPGDRLLLETDAPYLSPAPHRSQRNEPNWLPLIAARVAEVRGEDIATAVAASVATFEAIFTRGA